jgi:hypothetical protein
MALTEWKAMKTKTHSKAMLLVASIAIMTFTSSRMHADTGTCGGASITLPFTDVPSNNIFFCSIAEAYFSALTNGTTPTTYSPSDPVPREQMAAFITRTMDQSLKRGSRRAALGQWWRNNLQLTYPVGNAPQGVASDGADLWIANNGSGTVSRIRASDGAPLGTWTGATGASSVLIAHGLVFVTGYSPAKLYYISPLDPPGAVGTWITLMSGAQPSAVTTNGTYILTANNSGYVSFITLGAFHIEFVSHGGDFSAPGGILYDGSNVWVADYGDNKLKRLDSVPGRVDVSVSVGAAPFFPVFDGTNIWSPNYIDNSVSVVRVKDSSGNPLASPFVLATLTGNGLNGPYQASFDGERILVTNSGSNANSVSMWKAADLSPLGSFQIGQSTLLGACSDGISFWVTQGGSPGSLLRF